MLVPIVIGIMFAVEISYLFLINLVVTLVLAALFIYLTRDTSKDEDDTDKNLIKNNISEYRCKTFLI